MLGEEYRYSSDMTRSLARASAATVSWNTVIHRLCSYTGSRRIKFTSQKHPNPGGYVSLNRNPFHCLAVEMHRNPCRENAIGEGWNSIQLPITKTKSVHLHYTIISRSSTISQTRTSFFRFRLLYCVNCVLNLPMLNWCNSTEMIFKNVTCVKV